jgi:hypothetical protein
MKRCIVLLVVGVFTSLLFLPSCTTLLFLPSCTTRDISVSASVIAYCPKKAILAEGTFTFNPDEIIPRPEDTKNCCRPVGIGSPAFGENEEIQLTMSALKCGPGPLYYAFTVKYYDLNISYVISHKKFAKIRKFRIQLDSSQENQIKTPAGKRDVIYFEGKLLSGR